MSEGEKREESSSQRWWEFYGIRYGMGTVFGGIILYFVFKNNNQLKPLLFLSQDGKLDGAQLTLFAAYGLVYCYISSAPILVLHAGRFILANKVAKPRLYLRILLLFGLPLVALAITYYLSVGNSDDKLVCGATAFLLSSITIIQFVFLLPALFSNDKLFQFYNKLSRKREKAKGDLVNSYKHLREHGNSFFIVLLEMALGTILYTSSKYTFNCKWLEYNDSLSRVVLILLLWIIPSVLVWLVGTYFELNFATKADE